jgi:hypothetical protein
VSDTTQILIRALEASGSQREADLARAILGDAPAPAAAPEASEQTPGQKYVQEQAAAVEQAAAGRLPEGIASVEEIAAYEQLPPPQSGREQQERMKRFEELEPSIHYHLENGGSR